MKKKITQSLMSVVLIVLVSAGMAFAQKSSMGMPNAFSKLRKQLHQNANKVASHDDFPNLQLNLDWNGTGWDTISQYTNMYNPNGSLSSGEYQVYNNGNFAPSTRYSYTYDANGNVLESLRESWTGTAWENAYRTVTSYDAQGNEAQSFSESWSMGAWVINNGSRYTRQYNGANEYTEEIYQSYNTGSSTWENESKDEFQYVSGEWTTLISSEWNGSGWEIYARVIDITWHDFAKFLFNTARIQYYTNGTYTDSDRLTCTYSQFDSQECIYEYFDTAWEIDSKEIQNYDRLEHETRSEYYSWSGTWDFDGGYLYDNVYDAQDHTLEIIFKDLLTPTTSEVLAKQVFSSFFTSAPSALETNVELIAFPNPVTDQLNFDLKLEKNGPVGIALFDIQGRKRLETLSNYKGSTISIPVSESLENGVYFYQVKMGDAFAKGKVIVQH